MDEQTGVTTKLEHQGKGFFRSGGREKERDDVLGSGLAVQPPAYKERSGISLFFTLMFGIAAGALAFWLLAVPAIKQGIYKEANSQIVKYSESLASQGPSYLRSREKRSSPAIRHKRLHSRSKRKRSAAKAMRLL